MEENDCGIEQDLMEAVQMELENELGGQGESPMKKAKKDSLREMTKTLPDWSLEPPETFLS